MSRGEASERSTVGSLSSQGMDQVLLCSCGSIAHTHGQSPWHILDLRMALASEALMHMLSEDSVYLQDPNTSLQQRAKRTA